VTVRFLEVAQMTKRKSHPRVGSDFEDYLREEGRLSQSTAIAIKRVLAWVLNLAA